MTVTIQTLEPLDVSVRNNGTVDVAALMGTLDADVAATVADAIAAAAAAADSADDAADSATTAGTASVSASASAVSAAASAALAETITGLTGEDAAVAHLLGTDGYDTRTVALSGFVPQRTGDFDVPDGILVGNRPTAAGGSARLLLEVVHDVPDPDETILQHYSGYSFYHGTQTGAGSLQGGSDQATAWVGVGSSLVGTVLGYEGIGEVSGDDPSGSLPGGVIGMQGTALVGGVVDTPLAVSLRASGVRESSTYTGALDEARSLDVQEPVVGTVRRAIRSIGAARFVKGSAGNAVEIANASDALQWASNGTTLRGFASDGATALVALDPQDAAATRLALTALGGTTKGVVVNDVLSSGTGNHFEAQRGGVAVFAVTPTGNISVTAPSTATSPTDGPAGAPPAHPWYYADVYINGNLGRIPVFYPF